MKNHHCLNLIFVGIVCSLILVGYSRPQVSEEDIDKYLTELLLQETKDAETHFGYKNDYEKLNLPNLEIQNFNFTNNGSGNYYFTFNGDDIEGSEVGELKNPGTDNEIQAIKGQYQYEYIVNDTYQITVTRVIGYTADENGFRPFLIDIWVSRLLTKALSFQSDEKQDISTSCLASLCGGNIG